MICKHRGQLCRTCGTIRTSFAHRNRYNRYHNATIRQPTLLIYQILVKKSSSILNFSLGYVPSITSDGWTDRGRILTFHLVTTILLYSSPLFFTLLCGTISGIKLNSQRIITHLMMQFLKFGFLTIHNKRCKILYTDVYLFSYRVIV